MKKLHLLLLTVLIFWIIIWLCGFPFELAACIAGVTFPLLLMLYFLANCEKSTKEYSKDNKHIYNEKDTCTKCGCTRTAILGFGWSICEGVRQITSSTLVKKESPKSLIEILLRERDESADEKISRIRERNDKNFAIAMNESLRRGEWSESKSTPVGNQQVQRTAAAIGIWQRQQMMHNQAQIQSRLNDINENIQNLGDE